jgi:enoyl-CoA hydratase/carnithine racemase
VNGLQAETRGAVRWLVIDRPDTANAMTVAMADLLREELVSTAVDDGISVLVLTGTGTAFSSGADLRELLESPDAAALAGRATPMWPVDEIATYPKPFLACLNGAAVGGGATLAMAADLRIAGRSASLRFNLGRHGITPEFGSSFLLWRQVGYSTALELMLTGRTVDADEALRLRLVNAVVEDRELVAWTQALAEQMAALPTNAAARTKQVLRAGLDATWPEARMNEVRALVEFGQLAASSPDAEPETEPPEA